MMTHRDQIVEFLRLLASPEDQAEYERDVPIADVPAELVCMWFDDLLVAAQVRGFSEREVEAIASFSTLFEASLATLPQKGGLAALQQCEKWAEVVSGAQALLRELGSR